MDAPPRVWTHRVDGVASSSIRHGTQRLIVLGDEGDHGDREMRGSEEKKKNNEERRKLYIGLYEEKL